MKYGCIWIIYNVYWVDGGVNDWDIDVFIYIFLDEYGYLLLLLVVDIFGMEVLQIVWFVWVNMEVLLEGVYVVLYEGIGVFDFWGDVEVIIVVFGWIEVEVIFGVVDIMAMELMVLVVNDFVCNICFLLFGIEVIYIDQFWLEVWLSKLELFNVLRFMDWGYINSLFFQYWVDCL